MTNDPTAAAVNIHFRTRTYEDDSGRTMDIWQILQQFNEENQGTLDAMRIIKRWAIAKGILDPNAKRERFVERYITEKALYIMVAQAKMQMAIRRNEAATTLRLGTEMLEGSDGVAETITDFFEYFYDFDFRQHTVTFDMDVNDISQEQAEYRNRRFQTDQNNDRIVDDYIKIQDPCTLIDLVRVRTAVMFQHILKSVREGHRAILADGGVTMNALGLTMDGYPKEPVPDSDQLILRFNPDDPEMERNIGPYPKQDEDDEEQQDEEEDEEVSESEDQEDEEEASEGEPQEA
jgi:hypothetical protein